MPKLHIKDAGIWKEVKKLHIKDAGIWKTVINSILTSASLSPTSLTKIGPSAPATTAPVTCTPVGGEGHVFTWEKLSGSSAITANSPSAATTTFTKANVGVETATFRCKVVAGGVTVYSPSIIVDFEIGTQ